MRGATALRPQRLLLSSSSRSRGPLSRSAPANTNNEVCILCQHRITTKPLQMRPPFPTQRRWYAFTTRLASDSSEALRKDLPSQEAEESDTTPPEDQIEAGDGTPDVRNYYTIFPKTFPGGPPPNSPFAVHLPTLRREFLKLQALAHPDKFAPGPAKQRAETLSARINEAYRTLSDPLNRAQYLLSQWHGIDVTAEDGAAEHPLDPEMLMEVMEVQETVEALGDAPEAEAVTTITRLREQNAARIEQSVGTLCDAFDHGDIEAARAECVRLRFWYSLEGGLREWEPGRAEIRLVH